MNNETFDHLKAEYDHLFHDSMRALPDGWIKPLANLLDRIYKLSSIGPANWKNNGLINWGLLRVEVYQSSAMAFFTPIVPVGTWNPERALECIVALSEFHGETQETCSVCGAEGHLRMRILGGNKEGVFCDEHAGEAEQQIDRAASLYQECRDLFPPVHGKSINLDLPDYLYDVVAAAFRSILKLVIQEGVVGKVLVTRVEMDDGALFVRVRYQSLTAVHLGVQMTVNQMISDLEVAADEATRKHQGSAS